MYKRFQRLLLKEIARYNVYRKGFWFIDIPRTSSSAIRTALGKNFGFPYGKHSVRDTKAEGADFFGDHQTAYQMNMILGPTIWNSIYKFTLVRNPFPRILSLYRLRSKYNKLPPELSFEEYVFWYDLHFGEVPFFDISLYDCRRQTDFLCNRSGEIAVDEVFRFEDRKTALTRLTGKLGITFNDQKVMASDIPSDDYKNHYTMETRNIIEKIYSRDLSDFNYSF